MSKSVWLQEVDTALLTLVPTIVKYYNASNVLTTVPVNVRDPEGEFVIQTFPSVSIFNYDQRFADVRYDREPVKVLTDAVHFSATMEKSALPYDLFYQIDFWAKYHVDINEMTRRWLGAIPKNSVLTVLDSDNTLRTCKMEFVGFGNADYVKGTERVFHRVYSYRIWVELDETAQTTTPMVTVIDIQRR